MATGTGSGTCPASPPDCPNLADLGVDAVWLSPFYRSPQADAGYDVADYRDVDPLFGTLADFDALLARAHELGLKVIVDIVPNHSSDEHPWFQAALAAAPGSTERARYIFRDGQGAEQAQPPNNWLSVFGGPAWTRVTREDGTLGQWYLHLFDPRQPDYDWTNPEVRAEFESILEFWLDRGVDGFRVDVAHSLVKQDGLPDFTPDPDLGVMGFEAPGVTGHAGADADGPAADRADGPAGHGSDGPAADGPAGHGSDGPAAAVPTDLTSPTAWSTCRTATVGRCGIRTGCTTSTARGGGCSTATTRRG